MDLNLSFAVSSRDRGSIGNLLLSVAVVLSGVITHTLIVTTVTLDFCTVKVLGVRRGFARADRLGNLAVVDVLHLDDFTFSDNAYPTGRII